MKEYLTKETKNLIFVLSVTGIILLSSYFIISEFDKVQDLIRIIVKTTMPFIIGFAVAFILAPLLFRIEAVLFKFSKLNKKQVRAFATAGSIVFLIFCITIFFVLITPQIISSVISLSASIEDYIATAEVLLHELSEMYQANMEIVEWIITSFESGLTGILQYLSDYLPTLITNTISASIKAVQLAFNFIVGLVVAVYILFDYERFHRQARMVLYAILPNKYADELLRIAQISSEVFNKFVIGKAIDSLIIGILCLIGCLILGFPYAYLIAFVVGITNMIPFFGPFIGAIPCALLLFLVKPIYLIWFGLFILVLQQLDGNVIGPYILGDALGLPSIWIMFAVLVGGGLFGVVGMFLGVPIFAILYLLFKEFVIRRMRKKNMLQE
ncbi:MAG: AI-2E family transporter [Erysipelotrichaceae bacterium]|nr:AI-2E family transporter [Erysipelotrichaceae bacterium]